MKYFQHDLLCREDDKIWELFEAHGMVGYAAWWVILEELYKAEESGFQIEATETYLKRLSRNCRVSDHRTFPRILDTLSELGLIDPQLWQENIIYSASVISRGDYYVQKKAKARARKQKERAAKKEKAETLADKIHNEKLAKISDVTRDNADVTHPSLSTSRTNTYTDTNAETESYSNPYSGGGDEGEKKQKTKPAPMGTHGSAPPPRNGMYTGSAQFLEERPWLTRWRNVNPEYDQGFLEWASKKLQRFEVYRDGANIADVKRYLGKGNYDTQESNQRASAISAWWEEFQHEKANQPKRVVYEVVESEFDRLLRGGIAS